MIVQTENLKKRYGDHQALKGINLALEAGGIIGLLGPNGAGKTTLVEIIEGLRKPSEGRVTVLGVDVVKHSQALKERIGVQLQSTSLPEDLTPIETLRLFASFYADAASPDAILERVDLVEKAKTRNRFLSGGQQQRLAIGLALINNPELILLDEPSTGLDPVARRSIHAIINDLRAQGRTVLLTTHYIEEAEKLCDRVLMLRAGEIVADGTPFELVGQSAGTSTIWLDVDGPFNPAPLLAAGATDQGTEGTYYRFSTIDPTSAILALAEILKAQNVNLTDLRLKRPTLEDVYLELVGAPEADDYAPLS